MLKHLPFAMSSNRKSYTIQHKLQVLKWHHANEGNGHATANHFGLDRKVISWLKKEDVFKKQRCMSHEVLRDDVCVRACAYGCS